jgi:hypothetical protein
VERLDEELVWSVVNEIPPLWYESESEELEKLARALIARRSRVRELIAAFRSSPRNPFPEWKDQA